MERSQSPVLISWIAVNNDPYERKLPEHNTYRLVDGKPVPGPTLTVLLDSESPFAGKIGEAVFLHQEGRGTENERGRRAVEETVEVLRKLKPHLNLRLEPWSGDDPTDHHAIFEFLQKKAPELRTRYSGRKLVIHISPGTPSMQTLWVLMAETGFITPPFVLVKSLRKTERRGPSVVELEELGIETFYKAYMTIRPRQVSSQEQGVVWDPAKFRTERMQQLFTEARRFASLNVPVLLLGERGTGKTTLASWIRLHSHFRREAQDQHWPAVACGQYNPETMRSELFGHKEGAFTDAKAGKEGLLSAADGDTLFLDEVGDMSRDLQRLLIKAIEEKKYTPLGDDRPRRSDFRLLCATNVENDELQRRLDPDFHDRISLLTLHLPPLSEIRDELQWLWEDVYKAAALRSEVDERHAQLDAALHRRIITTLERHPLSGNLRDLQRVAYRLLAARNDPHAPLSPDDAVAYALQGLEAIHPRPVRDDNSLAKAVARAFTESSPLDGILDAAGRIRTVPVIREIKAYLGRELRRLVKERKVSEERICDVGGRTLREWAKDM